MRGRVFYIPEEVASTPADGECIAGAWWSCHPEKGLAFYYVPSGYFRSEEPSPQCNQDRRIVEQLTKQLYPDHVVKKVPVVFMAHALRAVNKGQS